MTRDRKGTLKIPLGQVVLLSSNLWQVWLVIFSQNVTVGNTCLPWTPWLTTRRWTLTTCPSPCRTCWTWPSPAQCPLSSRRARLPWRLRRRCARPWSTRTPRTRRMGPSVQTSVSQTSPLTLQTAHMERSAASRNINKQTKSNLTKSRLIYFSNSKINDYNNDRLHVHTLP